MSSEMRYTDDDLRVIVQDWSESDPDQAVAINLARECLRHRALLARTEARAPHHPLAICPTCKDYYEVCECTPDAAPVAVAWVLAYPDGSISSFAAVYRRKENAEKHIASYGGSLGLVPMPLYTHPHDASGDAREAERYRWLRDEASRAQLEMFADRRGTRLAADRLCDAGIDIAMQAKEAK